MIRQYQEPTRLRLRPTIPSNVVQTRSGFFPPAGPAKLKRFFSSFCRGLGHRLYKGSSRLLRTLCRTHAGRGLVECVMRAGGRALLWSFNARPQQTAQAAKAEWERILSGIGLDPRPMEGSGTEACATCFSRCSLELKAGDTSTCDAVMSINDEMLARLGARMVIAERLTEPHATRCVVRVAAKPRVLAGERELWCDDATAEGHFDRASGFYDFLMGYFEVPANNLALRSLRLPAGACVVELGVGTGLALRSLLKRAPEGTRFVAVDRSRRMIEKARQRIARPGWAARAEFVRADAVATGLASESFDCVFSSFLLDQFDLDKRLATLGEARRLLRSGGVGCFVVMDGVPAGTLDRVMARLYNAGYARWNPIWKALFAGYAPHCRPICLAESLRASGFTERRRLRAHIAGFPVAIFHVVRT